MGPTKSGVTHNNATGNYLMERRVSEQVIEKTIANREYRDPIQFHFVNDWLCALHLKCQEI